MQLAVPGATPDGALRGGLLSFEAVNNKDFCLSPIYLSVIVWVLPSKECLNLTQLSTGSKPWSRHVDTERSRERRFT